MARNETASIPAPPGFGPTPLVDPAQVRGPALATAIVRRQLGALAAEQGLSPVVLAGVKGLRRWDDLLEVSEDELATAIRDFQSITLR